MLKEYRLEKKMSQEKLEELTGIDRKTIFRIENNLNMPLIDTFGKIATTLGLTDEQIGKEIRKIVTEKSSKK